MTWMKEFQSLTLMIIFAFLLIYGMDIWIFYNRLILKECWKTWLRWLCSLKQFWHDNPFPEKKFSQHRIDDKRALKWDSNEVELWVYDPLGSLTSFNRFYSGNFIVEMWFCNWTKLRNYANCSIVALHIEGSKWISRYFSQARSWWGNCACRNIAATFLFLDFTSLIIISTDLTRFFLFPVSSSCDLNETEHFFIK